MKRSKVLLLSFTGLLVIALILALTPSSIETHTNQKLVKAPRNIVWNVISDVANYHHYATGLSDVQILSGQGEGMLRSCSDDHSTWTETCTAWHEGSHYAFNVNMDSDFPYPFRIFNGRWSVEEKDPDQTFIVVEFEYQFPQRWMQWLYGDDTHALIDEGNASLMENWVKRILEISRKEM